MAFKTSNSLFNVVLPFTFNVPEISSLPLTVKFLLASAVPIFVVPKFDVSVTFKLFEIYSEPCTYKSALVWSVPISVRLFT